MSSGFLHRLLVSCDGLALHDLARRVLVLDQARTVLIVGKPWAASTMA
jgi:hypothetical protein